MEKISLQLKSEHAIHKIKQSFATIEYLHKRTIPKKLNFTQSSIVTLLHKKPTISVQARAFIQRSPHAGKKNTNFNAINVQTRFFDLALGHSQVFRNYRFNDK